MERLKSLFQHKLETLIKEEIKDRAEALSQGSANDWSDYQNRVGVIKGLNLALDLCEETQKQNDGA